MLWGRSVTWVFIVVWLGVGTAWLILDWLGNPNRGAFRPSKGRTPRPFLNGRNAWRRRRAERDAAVRATLRDRYGRSSLRVLWSKDREQRTLDADTEWVTDPLRVADAEAPDEGHLYYESLLLEARFEPPDDLILHKERGVAPVPRGWTVGADPFVPTRAGRSPSKATIRARIWKNTAAGHLWECENGRRMHGGKPPKRVSPESGKTETARVDLALGLPYWPGESTEDFDAQSESLQQ